VGPIARDSLDVFLNGAKASDASEETQTAEIVEYENPAPAKEIVARALSKLDSDDYSLFSNNCEHFATWCVTGDAHSKQVGIVKWSGLLGLLINNYILESDMGPKIISGAKETAIAVSATVIGGAIGGIPGAIIGAGVAASRHVGGASDKKKDGSGGTDGSKA
jgi:hypothetical protein